MTAGSWRRYLLLLALIWGSSFLLIKVALDSFDPVQVTTFRLVLGSLTLLVVLRMRGIELPRGRYVWTHAVVAGALLNAIPFTLIAWGETRLGSIQPGLWNATTPLVTLLVMLLVLRDEPPSREVVGGLLLGCCGVVLLLAPWQGIGGGSGLAHAAFGLAAACYGVGAPYLRRVFSGRPESVVALSAAQLLCAAAIMLVASLFTGPLPSATPEPLAVLALAALGVLGTGIAYVLYTTVIRRAGAPAGSSVTYLMPVVATTLGVVVLGEQVGWHEPLGGAVIIAGVIVASRRPAIASRPLPVARPSRS